MRRFDVEGFDAGRYISEHNGNGVYDDDAADYPLYSQRSLEDEPAFSTAPNTSRPIGYVEPNYGQAAAYQRQPPQALSSSMVLPPGVARPAVARPPPASIVYYYDPATQTYVAAAAPPPSLSASMRGAPAPMRGVKKVVLPPGQAPPGMTPAAAAPVAPPSAPPSQPTAPPLAASVAASAPPPTVATVNGYAPPANRKEVAQWAGTQKWTVSAGSACCSAPCVWLGALCCPCCMLGSQRGRLLGKDWSHYRCCAGLCGARDCCSDDCGRCGMCCEALFCCPCALHSNRYILQKRYNLERSCCDRCVADMACCCNDSETCCGWCAGGICDCWYTCAFPCLFAQQYCQLKAMTPAVVPFIPQPTVMQ